MGKNNYQVQNLKPFLGPVVIGGIGGSGTRVIAELLQLLDIYLGDDLNESLDNLTYTLIFKRKRWYYKNRNNNDQIIKGLTLLEKIMISKNKFKFGDYLFLVRAVLSMSIYGHNKEKAGNGFWSLLRVQKILATNKPGIKAYKGWGWKEPNSHLILKHMNACFQDFKYIHCVRNGLDMAFSLNQQQLFNWGPLFGVYPPKSQLNLPEASFRYWVEANKNAISTGLELGPTRFHLVNYDQLCQHPETEIKKIISFVGLDPDVQINDSLIKLPHSNKSSGRFRTQDISWVSADDKIFMKKLGFAI